MSDETDIDGAAWAWEKLDAMAERWRETPEWHEGPFHDGRIHVTTAELHAAAILCYRKSIGLEAALSSTPTATPPTVTGNIGSAAVTPPLGLDPCTCEVFTQDDSACPRHRGSLVASPPSPPPGTEPVCQPYCGKLLFAWTAKPGTSPSYCSSACRDAGHPLHPPVREEGSLE